MRSNIVKEKDISSEVSEIVWYTPTHRDPVTLLYEKYMRIFAGILL